MKSVQLKEGHDYALEIAGGDDAVPVTLKSTQARYPSKVIVVPHGASSSRQRGIEVPASRLICDWDEYLASNMEMISTSAFRDVLWIPKRDEVVELEGTGSLEWTVVEVEFEEEEGWAVIRSEVFGRPQERTVPVTQIRRRLPDDRSAMKLQAAFSDEGIAPLRWDQEDEPSPEPKRIEPVRNVQPSTVAERLVFSERACEVYRKLGWCRRGQEQSRMRREVRRRAFLGSTRGKRGFVRYVVPGRFEFGLESDPTTVEGDLWVDEIVDLRSEKAKSKFQEEVAARRRKRSARARRGKQRMNSDAPNRKKRNRRRRPGP
jgi:hypothetical protein